MQIRHFLLLLGYLFGLQQTKAAPMGESPNDSLYYVAFDDIKAMLESKAMPSFKDAVFLTENAYYQGNLSYIGFNQAITFLAQVGLEVAYDVPLEYTYDDSLNIRQNYGLTTILTDSFNYRYQGVNGIWTPTQYNFDDPLGQSDWSNTMVTNLLLTGKGTCHSLPFLYKILADETATEAYLALAPSHYYVKVPTKDYTILSYNVELTNGTHPSDAHIFTTSYVTTEAVQSGMYMRGLTNQESIALTLLDLAQSYRQLFPEASLDFPLACVNLALDYFPISPNGRLMKIAFLVEEYHQDYDSQVLTEINLLCQSLLEDGYDEMPKEMFAQGLNPNQELTTSYIKENTSDEINPYLAHLSNDEVLSVSKGQQLEVHQKDGIEAIGAVLYNRQTGRVEEFLQKEAVGNLLFSPELVGKFLSVDPLSPEYPWYTPYQFAGNKPINCVDLDGLEELQVNIAKAQTLKEPGIVNVYIPVMS